MLASSRPVIAVCATRTGSGKSQTSREVARILKGAGLRVALVRHPMPYHDLERIPVQRFATVADIDESNPTIEEREEYELPVEMGLVMFAGVDYAAILAQAESEADVVIWDGGNNDMPFSAPISARGRRPAPCRRRAHLLPQRGEPAGRRRADRQQGRQRDGGAAEPGARRHRPGKSGSGRDRGCVAGVARRRALT